MFAHPSNVLINHHEPAPHQVCVVRVIGVRPNTLHIDILKTIKNTHHINIQCVRAISYRENMMLTTQYKTMNPPVYKNMRNKNGATCKIIHPKIK